MPDPIHPAWRVLAPICFVLLGGEHVPKAPAEQAFPAVQCNLEVAEGPYLSYLLPSSSRAHGDDSM